MQWGLSTKHGHIQIDHIAKPLLRSKVPNACRGYCTRVRVLCASVATLHADQFSSLLRCRVSSAVNLNFLQIARPVQSVVNGDACICNQIENREGFLFASILSLKAACMEAP